MEYGNIGLEGKVTLDGGRRRPPLPVLVIAAAAVFASCDVAFAAAGYVQGASSTPQGSPSFVSTSFTAAQTAGDLNVVVVGWMGASSQISSITDTTGNAYSLAVGPTVAPDGRRQSIYFAKNIGAAFPGRGIVFVSFNAATTGVDVRIAEYSGLDVAGPLVAAIGASGTGVSMNSGSLNAVNGMLVAASLATGATTAGSGFTQRIQTANQNILADKVVTASGSYNATATLGAGANWVLQLVAFKTPGTSDSQPPTAPTNLNATPVSSTQINLSWTASTDDVGVTGYKVERCTGASCADFLEIATQSTTSFSSANLTPTTTYRFRVRATDAAGNLGPYSDPKSAATASPPDSQPPTAPTSLTATVNSSSQISLSWGAASDNVGVTGYRIERCQGSACNNFASAGSSTATSFSNLGLSPLTSYSYQVRAVDAAGNVGPPSNVVTKTTVSQVETVAYTYDARGRLSRVTRNGGVNSGVATDYAYDKANNRRTQVTTGSSH